MCLINRDMFWFVCILFLCGSNAFRYGNSTKIHLHSKRALQRSHEKSISEKRMDSFFNAASNISQEVSLVALLNRVATTYLSGCTSIILYDFFTEGNDMLLLEQLFKSYPISFLHGRISDDYKVIAKELLIKRDTCVNYILFMKDVMRCRDLIGEQSFDKVVVVARSSQWRVYEFLGNKVAQSFVNLLVIAQSATISASQESSYILFTHKLYVDALGSSVHHVLTSWRNGDLARPNVSLFPKKIKSGFAGHRFIVSVAQQPPFVIGRGIDQNDDIEWDGTEIRLIKLLSQMLNFTTEFKAAPSAYSLGSAEAVTLVIKKKEAHMGVAGLYITKERLDHIEMSLAHTQDCAAFISLTSTALPRYRAIMGPFHWTVWLALTLVYLLGIFPIAFSDKHTLKPLLRNPEEIENMFWYVFGTFTNAFTFSSKRSWSQSDKMATRLLIGFYWLFTIIVTACYTGSIIAFVTLPVFPATVDTVEQLLSGRYQIGTLDKGGWQYWFENTSDPQTLRLLKRMDYVPTVEEGLKNTTNAFFWSYAFLGSKAQLDYVVRSNFTTKKKRQLLHISTDCFVPFSVGITFQKNTIYNRVINEAILRVIQGGLMIKLKKDVEWIVMRSATGKLLAAGTGSSTIKRLSAEDRALTLDDTQGMFLLLGAGFLVGGASLLSEWLGGCFNFCKRKRSDSRSSIDSNPRSYDGATPREKLHSVQYDNTLLNLLHLKRNSRVFNHVPLEEKGSTIGQNKLGQNSIEANHVESSVTVHIQNKEPDEEMINYDDEIDEMFDFAHIFGEKTNNNFDEHENEEIDKDGNFHDENGDNY